MLPSPFYLLVALIPVLGYLGVIAAVRFSGRALVTTGGRDVAAIGFAISGLVVIGPLELFFPSTAAAFFGPMIWGWLAAFYVLCVTLASLTARSRLVIYGRTAEDLYLPLIRAARRLDPDADGDPGNLQVSLPRLKIRLRIDGHHGVDHAEVEAFERRYPPRFWSRLLGLVREEVASGPRTSPRRGFVMLFLTVVLAGLLVWRGIEQQALVVQEFRQWLWR